MKCMKLQSCILSFLLMISFTGYAGEIVDTNFLKFDLLVDNAYIRQRSSADFDFFSNVFSMDSAKYTAGGYIYGVAADRNYNVIYYLDEKNDYKFLGIDLDSKASAFDLVDKIAATRNGKVYAIDANREVIYYWLIIGSDTFNPAGKIEYNFKNLEDIYVDLQDNLYILDNEEERVYKYSTSTNSFNNAFLKSGSESVPYFSYSPYASSYMGKARGLVVMYGGYYIVFECGTILKFESNGALSTQYNINRNNLGLSCRSEKEYSECWLEGIACTPYGYILVLDTKDKKVHIFDEYLNYVASWYDPLHPIDDTVNEIGFINGYDNFFVAYSWGLCKYSLLHRLTGVYIGSDSLYPDYLCEDYKGIEIKLYRIGAGQIDVVLAGTTGTKEYKIKDKEEPYYKYLDFYWDGRDINGEQVEYGEYKLKFFFNNSLFKEFPVSIRQPPEIVITEDDGKIIDSENKNLTYNYTIDGEGYLTISIITPGDNFQKIDERIISNRIIDTGSYSQTVDSVFLDNLDDGYYKIRFQLVPPGLTSYKIDVLFKDKIFVVDNNPDGQVLALGEINNASPGFNPYSSSINKIQANFSLNKGAFLDISVLDEASVVVKKIYEHEFFTAGVKEIEWDGYNDNSTTAVAGKYRFSVKAEEDFLNVTREATGDWFTLDREPAKIVLHNYPGTYYFSPDEPSSPGVKDECVIEYGFNEDVVVDCSVLNSDSYTVRTIASSLRVSGNTKNSLRWDGRNDTGEILPDGRYNVRINTEDNYDNTYVYRLHVYLDNNRIDEAVKERIFVSDSTIISTTTLDMYQPVDYAVSPVEEGFLTIYGAYYNWYGFHNILRGQLADPYLNKVRNEFIVPQKLFPYHRVDYPDIALLDNGYVVAWSSVGDYDYEENDFNGYEEKGIYAQLYDNMGGITKPQFMVDSFDRVTWHSPKVAKIKNGFVIVWDSIDNTPPPYNTKLLAQIYDNAGNATSDVLEIEGDTSKNNVWHIVRTFKDNFIVLWAAYYDTNRADVMGQIFDYTGKALTTKFKINPDNPAVYSHTKPAFLDLGDKFLAIWKSVLDEKGLSRIHGQFFDHQGTKTGSELILSDSSLDRNNHDPFNVIQYKDQIVVYWGTYDSASNRSGFSIKRFTLDGQPIGETISLSSLENIGYAKLIPFNNQLLLTTTDRRHIYANLIEPVSMPEGGNLSAQIVFPAQEQYACDSDFYIKGFISDLNLDKYRLSLQNGTDVQILREDTQPVNGDICPINAFALTEGVDYVVKLEAWDKAGNYRMDSFILNRALSENSSIEKFTVDDTFFSVLKPPLIHFDIKTDADVTFELIDSANIKIKSYYLGLQNPGLTDYLLNIDNISSGEYKLKMIAADSIYGTSIDLQKFYIDNDKPNMIPIRSSPLSNQDTVKNHLAFIRDLALKNIKAIIVDENNFLIKKLSTAYNAVGTLEVNQLTETMYSAFAVIEPANLMEGNYKILLEAEDQAGNFISSEQRVVIDRTPPSFIIYSPDLSQAQKGVINIEARIDDDIGVIGYQIMVESEEIGEIELTVGKGGLIQYSWDTTLLEKQSLACNLKFITKDYAGNECIINKQIIIDNTPPTVNFIYKQPPGLQYYDNVTWNFTNPQNTFSLVTENIDDYSTIAKVYYNINDAQWQEYTTPFSLSQEGIYFITFYAVDTTGNKSVIGTESMTIDASNPYLSELEITNGFNIDNKIFTPSKVKIRAIPADVKNNFTSGLYHPNNCIKYRIEDGNWEKYNQYTPISIYQEGQVNIALRVTDVAGNIGELNINNLIIDIMPPRTKLETDKPAYYNEEEGRLIIPLNTKLSLSASEYGLPEAQSGVFKTYYTLNDHTNQLQYSEPFLIPENSPSILTFYSVDNVGNTEPLRTIEASIDNTAPLVEFRFAEITFTEGEGEDMILYTATNNSLSLSATDDLAGIKAIYYSLDGSDFSLYTTDIIFTEEKSYNLRYYAEDNAGLMSPVHEINIIASGRDHD